MKASHGRRRICAHLAAWALCASQAACSPASELFPPPVIAPTPEVERWPDVGAVVLDDVATFEYAKRPPPSPGAPPRVLVVIEHRRRIKILDEKGLQHATVRLRTDGLSTVTNVYARAVQPDGDIVRMDPNAIRAYPDPGEGRHVHSLKNIEFTVPGAEVGGLVEYRYDRAYVDADFVPPWQLGGSLPTARARVSLVSEPDIKLDFRAGTGEKRLERFPQKRETADGRVRYVFTETNLPPFYPEPGMGHPTRGSRWLAVSVTKVGDRRRMEHWDHAVQRLGRLLDRVDAPTQSGTVASRYRAVRDALAPVRRAGLGVLPPQSGEALLQGQPACPRDGAAVMRDALVGTGLEYYPAYLTGPEAPPLLEGFASIYPFSRAAVAVRVTESMVQQPACFEPTSAWLPVCRRSPGEFIFLDPLCEVCAFGELRADTWPTRALIATGSGARWVDVPLPEPAQHRIQTEIELKLKTGGRVSGTITGTAIGAAAQTMRRRLRRGELRQSEVVARALFGTKKSPALEKTRVTARGLPDQPLIFRSRMALDVDKRDYEDYALPPATLAGTVLPGAWREFRRHDAYVGPPRVVESRVSLDLPVGYVVDKPQPVELTSEFGRYTAEVSRRERVLTYEHRFVWRRARIDADEWPAFRRFLEAIREVEQRPMRITVRRP